MRTVRRVETISKLSHTIRCATLLIAGVYSQVAWGNANPPCATIQEPDASNRASRAPEVDEIVAGWRANREQFRYVQMKTVRVQAFAASLDDAIAGKYLDVPEPVTSDRSFVSDGVTSRFDEAFPPKLADAPRSQHPNRIEVRNGTVELLRLPKTNQNMLGLVGKRTYGPESVCFSQGAWMCSAAERGTAEYLGMRELNGRSLKELSVMPPDGTERYVFSVDQDRGYTPVRTEFRRPPEAEPHTAITVEELLGLPNNRWAPKRWISVTKSDDPTRPVSVTEETVTESDFDIQPPPELFDVAVSPGEHAAFEFTQSTPGPVETVRFPAGKISLSWFGPDGSIDAPDGAVERVPRSTAVAPTIDPALRRPLTKWQMFAVLAISTAIGFGGLALYRVIRRVLAGRSRHIQAE